MNPKFSLQINNPCSQNWDGMALQENSRFCSNCNKSVTDFTFMTDSQIITFFQNRSGEVCGRFSSHQLEKAYPISLRKTPWYMNRFLHFAVSGLLTLKTAEAVAQSPVKTEQTGVKNKGENKNSNPNKNNKKRCIEGKVITNHQIALENTIIMIKETGQSLKTGSDGKFRFDLPEDFSGKDFTLTFSHSNYQTESRTFSMVQLPMKNLLIPLYNARFTMGKVKRLK